METIQAKMFVRSLNNSSAKIVMAFLLARTALDVQELREWTGLKRETIYDGLDDLRALGKVEKQTLAHGRVVWLPAGDILPGFQMSEKWTPELQMSEKRTPSLLGGGESINLTLSTDSINPPGDQESEKRTSDFPNAIEILQHTDLLFDGALVVGRGLEDCEPLTVLAWCAYAYSQKNKLNGAGGLVRNRLKDKEPPPESAKLQWRDILPRDFLEALDLMEYTCEICQVKFKKMSELNEHDATHPKPHICGWCGKTFEEEIDLDAHVDEEHTPKVIIADESVTVSINGGITAEQAWQSVLGQLQMEMPRASFESWVRDSKAVRYDGNTLSVGVRNVYTRDWLESRLQSTVERLLVGIMNAHVYVVFVVGETEP